MMLTDTERAQLDELLRLEWEKRLQRVAYRYAGANINLQVTQDMEQALDAETREYHACLVFEVGHA